MPARTPEEVDALFEKYMNAGDLAAVVALYEEDGVLVAAPGQIAQGHDAIRAALESFLAMKPQFKLHVTNTIVAGDIAVLYNDWTATIGDQRTSGKAMEICRRQPDGTWRFTIDDPYARD
jgi:uncharacterized protein (TIGR02246 family)